MDYYNEIKNELVNNEINKSIKDYSKNKYELQRYYNVGKLLLEAGNQYGENIIGKYADKLMLEVGKKYDKSTLFKIRKFYLIFSDKKVAPLAPQLSWSHCLILLPLKDINKINYYMQQISKRLTDELKVKYDASSLNKMKKFYILAQKLATVSPNLSYSHYVELLPYDDINKVNYYIKIVGEQKLSIRKLREMIKSNEYEIL